MTGTVNTRSVEQTWFSMSMILKILLYPVCVVMQWMVILFLILRIPHDLMIYFSYFIELICAISFSWFGQSTRIFKNVYDKGSVWIKSFCYINLNLSMASFFFTISTCNSLLIAEKRITWCIENIPFWKRITFLAPGFISFKSEQISIHWSVSLILSRHSFVTQEPCRERAVWRTGQFCNCVWRYKTLL